MHNVPRQHQIECSAGSKSLSRAQKSLFLKYASLRKGSYLPQEDDTIMNNWKKFCEVCLINGISIHILFVNK